MGTLIESAFTGTIKSDEEMYALWLQAEEDLAKVGQSYMASSGVTVTLADLALVTAQVEKYYARLLAKRSYNGRNTADIEPTGSGDDL